MTYVEVTNSELYHRLSPQRRNVSWESSSEVTITDNYEYTDSYIVIGKQLYIPARCDLITNQ